MKAYIFTGTKVLDNGEFKVDVNMTLDEMLAAQTDDSNFINVEVEEIVVTLKEQQMSKEDRRLNIIMESVRYAKGKFELIEARNSLIMFITLYKGNSKAIDNLEIVKALIDNMD